MPAVLCYTAARRNGLLTDLPAGSPPPCLLQPANGHAAHLRDQLKASQVFALRQQLQASQAQSETLRQELAVARAELQAAEQLNAELQE